MRHSNHHTVLFDLDGTLLDTIGLIVESLRHTLAEHLDWRPDEAALVHGVGTPLTEQLRVHATAAGADAAPGHIAEMVATYRAHNLAHHDETVRAFPGAAALLDDLVGRGLRLGIVTSKPHDFAVHGLTCCGLDHYFPVVIGGDDIPRPKPDPMPVHVALEALGADAEGALFVGDSPHDLLAGRRAGVATAAALWGPFDPALLQREQPSFALTRLSDVARYA